MFSRRIFRKVHDPTENAAPTAWTWLFWFALLILLFQFALSLEQYVQTAQTALAFPYPIDYKEGPALNQALRLAQGQPVYRSDLTTPPFSVAYEPPLHWLVQAPLVRLFGPAYAYGRALSLIGALAAAILIGLTLFTITRDWVSALISGLTLLAFPYILYGSVIDQPDTLALALSWAGLFAVVRWPEKKATPALAALLFTLAIYTRQTYFLAGPLAGLVWLIYRRLHRQALLLAGFTLGFCAAAFLLVNLLARGAFYYTLFQANPAWFSWKAVTASFSRFFPDTYYLLISTALFLIVERISDRSQTWPLVLAYFTGALVASLFSGWAGSTVAAFYELIAAFAFAAGAIIVWMKRSAWLKVVLVLLLALQVGDLMNWSRAEFIPQVTAKAAAQSEVDQVYGLVRASGGRVLADEYLGMLPLSGQPILFQPIEFKMLNEQGRWDNAPVIRQIQEKQYACILFYLPVDNGQYVSERWSPDIRDAVYANYQLTGTLASVYIYKPKP